MPLITLLLGLLPGFFSPLPGISATIKQLIADVSGSAAAVLSSGVISQQNSNTILAAWSGVLNVLKTDPNLPQNTLTAIAQLEKAVQAALLNDQAAAQSVNWSLVGTITPVP